MLIDRRCYTESGKFYLLFLQYCTILRNKRIDLDPPSPFCYPLSRQLFMAQHSVCQHSTEDEEENSSAFKPLFSTTRSLVALLWFSGVESRKNNHSIQTTAIDSSQSISCNDNFTALSFPQITPNFGTSTLLGASIGRLVHAERCACQTDTLQN